MIYAEYGKENNKTVIFLHGGGLSRWNFHKEALLLQNNYHIVIPVLHGHGENKTPFTTIENNADDIIDFIDKKLNGKVFALCGLSLGGQIVTEILSRRKDICDYAVIESASVIPMRLTNILIGPAVAVSYFLISKKWFSRLQFNRLKIDKSFYDDYYKDSCKISKNSMINFMRANSSYALKQSISNSQTKALIIAGGKENSSVKKSAVNLNNSLADSRLIIKENLYHGQLSLNYPEEYVKILENFIDDKNKNHQLSWWYSQALEGHNTDTAP